MLPSLRHHSLFCCNVLLPFLFLFFFRSRCFLNEAYSLKVSGVAVHKTFLRQNDHASPYCLAVSNALELNQKPTTNFLATQVWPSAREASYTVEKCIYSNWTVCEFGCGPGLPSITAAIGCNAKKVYATDIDSFALDLADEAYRLQNENDNNDDNSAAFETRKIDLTVLDTSLIPVADLYIFSDVFESSTVALGAARLSDYILKNMTGSKIWVFAQTDRVQREIYLHEMKRLLKGNSDENEKKSLGWTNKMTYNSNNNGDDNDHSSYYSFIRKQQIFLCDVDETLVRY